MSSKTIYKIILIVVVCVVAFFLSRYFFSGQSDSIGLTVTSVDGQILADQNINDAESKQFLDLLASVRGVSDRIREEFVNNNLFVILEDYTVTVSPKTISRSNPFLPIGQGGTYTYVSSATTGSSSGGSDFGEDFNNYWDSGVSSTTASSSVYQLDKTKAKASVIDSIQPRRGR